MFSDLRTYAVLYRRRTAWEAIGLSPVPQAQNACERLTTAYMTVLCAALPLLLHNGFFDITETKWLFYCIVSAAYLALLMAMQILLCRQATTAVPRTPLDTASICFLLFAVPVLLTTFFSDNWVNGLLGAHNRYQGVVTILLYIGVYFALKQYFHPSRGMLLALLASFCFVTLLAAVNSVGLDPLAVYAQLTAFDRARYLSTLGNINFYSAYLSLLLPFVLALWCRAETRLWQWITGVTLICGALGLSPSGSESLLAALLTAALLLPLPLFSCPCAMRRLFAGYLCILITLSCSALLARLFPLTLYPPFFLRVLMRPAVLLSLIVLCVVMCRLLGRCNAMTLLRLRKPYCIAICGLLALSALGVVMLNTALTDVSLGALDRFVKLSPSWGTDRGRIWQYCWELFCRADWPIKFFGGGTDALYAHDASMVFFGDAVLDNAHNEYLHYLLTVGVTGFAAYVGALALTISDALQRPSTSPLPWALAMGILSYAVQAFFNIAQPVSTPFLFLFLGMLAGIRRHSGEMSAE